MKNMLSKAKIIIVLLVVISSIFTITSLATTYWMEGCFDVHDYLTTLHNLTSQIYDKEWSDNKFSAAIEILEGPWVCCSSGLFNFRLEAANSFMKIMGHTDESSVLRATASLVIISLILSAAGAITCILGSHLDPRGSEGRNKFIIGMVTIAFSALCLFTGMVVFTALMTPATADYPMLFFDQFQHHITGLRRDKRNIRPLEETLTMIEDAGEVWFHYSYYLGWVSFLLLLVVSIFNCVILWRRKHSNAPQIAMT